MTVFIKNDGTQVSPVTVIMPTWMRDEARKAGINFSDLLRKAIRTELEQKKAIC